VVSNIANESSNNLFLPGWLDEDPCYAGLAKSRKKREERYEAWVKDLFPKANGN